MTHPLRPVEKRLNVRFKNRDLLQQALTHPSFRHEGADTSVEDNQRLEFLGDAVLGILSAEWLYRNQPNLREGSMTKFRSALTNRNQLNAIGARWDIGEHLRMGRGESQSGGAERESNVADMVEAVLGAVYLDGGNKAASKFFQRHFESVLIGLLEEGKEEDNPKGTLQELSQQNWKCSPHYRIVDETGPSHARHYVAEVSLKKVVLATGSGSSKRTAEAEAARAAAEELQNVNAEELDARIHPPAESP